MSLDLLKSVILFKKLNKKDQKTVEVKLKKEEESIKDKAYRVLKKYGQNVNNL